MRLDSQNCLVRIPYPTFRFQLNICPGVCSITEGNTRHIKRANITSDSYHFTESDTSMPESLYSCRHSPLPLGSHIRLLRLIPHEDEAAPIQCQLFNYSLHESIKKSHRYEALSYAWGGLDKPLSIYIDNVKMPVTVNLHAALSHLRDPFFERILWVDAICINQEDLEERSHQVQLMAKIYSKANRVIVWLGESEPGSDQALEDICLAANEEIAERPDKEIDQQPILNLLRRPWFERIWVRLQLELPGNINAVIQVLQEIAAARHIVIMCGSMEIDGYAFCLGLKSLELPYAESWELQSLPSLTYLIERAGLRPKYTKDLPDRFSLNIRCFAELLDMFHTRKATNVRDKMYALLGMSSDNPGEGGLRPNYKIAWKDLFQQLVKFILGKNVSVDTFEGSQSAVIQGRGCILGVVSSVSDDKQNVIIISKDAAWCSSNEKEWTLQVSAIPIREGDIICLLEGASKTTIIRPFKDYFTVVLIAAAPLNEDEHSGLSELFKSAGHFPYDFLLVWSWEKPLRELQDQKECRAPANNSQLSKYTKAEFGEFLDEDIRTWNVAVILGAIRKTEDSRGRLRKIFESNGMAFKEMYGDSLEGQYGLTPLSWAAMEGQEAIVKGLLTKDGIDPDLNDGRYGQTPLAWAASRRQAAVVKLLLKTGRVEINSVNYEGKTPLLTAFDSYDRDVTGDTVDLLLKKGADIMARDCLGRTALHLAVQVGDLIAVILLLNMEANITAQDNSGETVLHLAARHINQDLVELLLEKGADMTIRDYSGATALHSAAQGQKGRAEMLLESEADISPLRLEVKRWNREVVELLLRKGADIEAKDYSGATALHLAAAKGDIGSAELLLTHGADITAQTKSGATALHLAAESGCEVIVKLLLDRGADIMAEDYSGWTALHKAAFGSLSSRFWWSDNVKVVHLLLERGADVTARNHEGNTALQLVTGKRSTVEELLKYAEHLVQEREEVLADSGSHD